MQSTEKPINAPIHSVWCTCHLCQEWIQRQRNEKSNLEKKVS